MEMPIVNLTDGNNAQIALIAAVESAKQTGGAGGYSSSSRITDVLSRADSFLAWLNKNG